MGKRDADPVALRFQAYGMQSFVFEYTVGKGCYQIACNHLAILINYLRKVEVYQKYDIDPNRIVLVGFSAGAHLATSIACYWKKISRQLELSCCRPNALITIYPVITSNVYAHEESVNNCVGIGNLTKDEFSLELHIPNDMPPCFIVHCVDDENVSVMNSILFMEALKKNNIEFEAHIFPKGGHDFAFADDCTARIESQVNERCSIWFTLALKWIEEVL